MFKNYNLKHPVLTGIKERNPKSTNLTGINDKNPVGISDISLFNIIV